MPSYEVTCGAQTKTFVAATPRAAGLLAIADFGINASAGTHFCMVPDGNDAAALEVRIDRGRLAQPWTETPTLRVRTQAAPTRTR